MFCHCPFFALHATTVLCILAVELHNESTWTGTYRHVFISERRSTDHRVLGMKLQLRFFSPTLFFGQSRPSLYVTQSRSDIQVQCMIHCVSGMI